MLRSGELPGQYMLEYYVDASYRKLKGRIDLDQCEQVCIIAIYICANAGAHFALLLQSGLKFMEINLLEEFSVMY